MGHRLSLGMQHRVVDEALYASRSRRRYHHLADGNFVGAHIGADVIDSPYPFGRAVDHCLRTNVADDDLLRSQVLNDLNLLPAMYQGAGLLPACTQGPDNGPSRLAGRSREQDHTNYHLKCIPGKSGDPDSPTMACLLGALSSPEVSGEMRSTPDPRRLLSPIG